MDTRMSNKYNVFLCDGGNIVLNSVFVLGVQRPDIESPIPDWGSNHS